ncbi:protein-disulfide reductase DsbD domain-containing protein [Shewanella sp. MEBiC00475]|uniref:protein-disulfide reductase DsbD domain-containing protein n=1 Tax=Shewanella sp. MEBiC00475 TaxID=2575361 RepID=UPI0010C00F79|nr:protein-disulfide reductase DsbD domain-containing protein [Shewanella sp. MEBiC00475]
MDIVKSQVDSFLICPTYDFIDGGMHRYSETGDWETPHFEKMLYDQAQLMHVLVKLYLITGMSQYSDIANQTVNFVESKMKYNGYAVSSLSALSNDIEGGYYQTTIKDFPLFSNEQHSLFKHSPKSQLFSLRSIDLPSTQTINTLSQLRKKRFPLPMADLKGILSWNALYAISLAEMYSATLDERIQQKMYHHIDLLTKQFYRDGQLYRIVYDGRASVDAKLDDHALFIQALLLKYGISGNANDLALAVKLSHQMGILVDNMDPLLLAVDDQLPSMVAMAINAYKQLYLATGESEMTDRMGELMTRSVQSPLTISQLSLLSAANRTVRNNLSPYFFGKGKGVVNFVKIDNDLILQISLANGWHINSNKPLDKKLIPTTIQFINDDPVKADFPEAKQVNLSFSQDRLSVYDSTIQIVLDNQQFQRTRRPIKLNLQMCSDKLCLLPETIVIVPPLLLIR